MSISSQPSPSLETDDWNELVAREVAHQAAIEVAFDRSDACAAEGVLQLALEWLDRASELSGGLSEACRTQRACFVAELKQGQK